MARSIWGSIAVSLVALAACASPSENDNAGDNYAGGVIPSGEDDGDASGGTSDDETTGDNNGSDGSTSDNGAQAISMATGCPAYGGDVYTPYKANAGIASSGTVSSLPWRGKGTSYPDTIEDFRGYGPGLPTSVECGSDKNSRDHLDVTAGCLSAITADGGNVGEIHGTSDGYFRSFALPWDAANSRPVAWTDMGVEYRFWFSQWTGNVSGPGFKAFARYMTEYDLYVASWRMDGVVQIQKKHCGQYTVLARDASYGAPSPNTWHTMRFEVVGNQQRLYLDGRLAMTTTDDTIKRGTAGIRIDSAEGARIDDWRVYAP